jgi:hypothetical protein
MICSSKSAAMKVYQGGILKTMSVYVVVILGVTWFVKHHHPQGVAAYILAVLPAIPIVAMLAVMGIYLRDEKDEFLRWVTIQAMLWSIGVVLALTTVVGFLQNFAGMDAPPMFYVFVVYWLVFGVVNQVLLMRSRQGSDD